MYDFRLNKTLFSKNAIQKDLMLHKVKNCFLRNIISEKKIIQEEHYQKNLKLDSVQDLQNLQLLKYLCSKSPKSLDDRNMLRRMMFLKFGESIMREVKGESFYNNLMCKQFEEGSNIRFQDDSKYFYFVFHGRIKFTNSKMQKIISEGEFYGHEQIMSDQQITEIQFFQDTTVLVLRQQDFNNNLDQYFRKQYKAVERELEKHIKVVYATDKFTEIYFYLALEKIDYPPKSIIASKNQRIKFLYFYLKGILNEELHKSRIIGLKEILQQRQIYEKDFYTQTQSTFYRINIKLFKKFANLEYLRQKLKIEIPLQESLQNVANSNNHYQFKITKAKISLERRSSKFSKIEFETTARIMNDFFFLSEKRNSRPIKKFRSKKLKTDYVKSNQTSTTNPQYNEGP